MNGAQKTKLRITSCTINSDGTISVKGGKQFDVMLNPSNFHHEHAIRYNEKEAFGQLASEEKFTATEAEKVNFELVIDSTGVANIDSSSHGASDVATQISQLNDIVYNYDGDKHEPNHVRLLWGSFIFFGRLTSLSTDYTLFKPSGEPLRAKVKVAFAGFMSKDQQTLKANRSSPDLPHRIEVKAGDTLPLLCYRIYSDCSYYAEVAKVNNISNFRVIKPGTKLYFPPLR